MPNFIKASITCLAAALLASNAALGCCGYGPASEPPVRHAAAAQIETPRSTPTGGGTPANAAPSTPESKTPAGTTPSTSNTPMTPSTTTPGTPTTPITPDTSAAKPAVKTQLATFGGGCFWGVEEFFRTTKGVVSTRVGYAGGKTQKPTYKEVCTDTTGHAEVVEITFDPSVVTYDKLVELFFKIHDPTQVNRQGPDYGTQYRTVIFTHSAEQKATAEAIIKRLNESGKYKKPIATKVEGETTFWAAEDYHQQYFFNRGIPNTCHIIEE
jgi:peptide-methionine (S)-S-oxide reductase